MNVASSVLTITELGDVCARLRARSLDLFEATGGWVATTEPGELQRRFATATHRHAWHAELWADRCPAIPPIDLDELTARHRTRRPDVDPDHRLETYRAQLDELVSELDSLEARVDPELDPSTEQVITLVRSDLCRMRPA
jgi:hypothetical protein